MLETILVALDESKLSDQVMAVLKQVTLTEKTMVILAHVIPSTEPVATAEASLPHGSAYELPYRQIERHLQDFQAELPCRSELEIVSGDPVEEIVRLANIHRADLVVLGTRGLTGMDRILQGSVSSQVLEAAPCSVLVVKGR